MAKRIVFYPQDKLTQEIIDPPKKAEIPEWYKKMPLHSNRGKELRIIDGEPNYTAKACMPFLDSFMSGYTFNLPCDILVEINAEGNHAIQWNRSFPAPVGARPLDEKLIPSRDKYADWNFSWITYWGIKLPKGYSALLTHPLNRTDLPFITTSGILDADKWGIWGKQPFSLVEGFQGIIPKGTPIIQIIPFKRHSWISTISNKLTNWATHEDLRRASVFKGYYKKKYWSKKDYS
jgi:hypothetical protein